jgi:hypothetical protein
VLCLTDDTLMMFYCGVCVPVCLLLNTVTITALFCALIRNITDNIILIYINEIVS